MNLAIISTVITRTTTNLCEAGLPVQFERRIIVANFEMNAESTSPTGDVARPFDQRHPHAHALEFRGYRQQKQFRFAGDKPVEGKSGGPAVLPG